jgi:hypothetical protein
VTKSQKPRPTCAIDRHIPHNSIILMKTNLGTIDRIIRLLAGGGLIAWAATGGPVWAWAGAILVLTALVGFCPLYCPLKLSTKGKCGGGGCGNC